MEKIFFALSLLMISTITYGQTNRKVEKLKDQNLIKVLNNLTLLTEKKTEELSIRVYEVGNPSGSAGKASCEITHTLYIAVSEYDEDPQQNLFTFGPLYNPKTGSWTGTDAEQSLFIEYGEYKSRKKLTLIISLDKVVVK